MKKSSWIILIIILVTIQSIIIAYSYSTSNKHVVTKDYIAVFKGKDKDKNIIYSTYLYHKNNQPTYTYINTKKTPTIYAENVYTEAITKKGILENKEKIFSIAEENKANSYVESNNKKTYSIESFKEILYEK